MAKNPGKNPRRPGRVSSNKSGPWAKKGMSAERAEIAARKKALSVDERHAERVARNLAARGA